MSAKCSEIGDFERFVGGQSSAEEFAAIEQHVAVCDACRGLLAEVRDNLLLVAPVRQAMARIDGAPTTHALPPSIGIYQVTREIGRGGMGIVYEAQQPNPRRTVAIKVLHTGHGLDGRIERMFRREAHALGRLKHPSIAAIHEAGRTEDGRSYFAMELIEGVPLTQFAESARLAARERLALFQRVCEAIAYAHQRGVIHRDLKPSNILVDGAGMPKVLDFGLAKILEPDDSTPAVTSPNEEGRIQGTLPYMSPEQVRGDLSGVDIRSDIYSLGVILHELLSGQLPYSIDRTRLTEAARTICERAPPRLGTIDRSLSGDIETIVLKAMEKDPDRRYSSASALAEDIANFLAGRPIQARPPTLVYQVRKLVGRHKVPAAMVATMLVLIVGFAVSVTLLYARATSNLHRALEAEKLAADEARRARQETDTATQIKDFLVDVFRVSEPGIAQGRTVTARELLDAAAKRVRNDLSREPVVQATMMQTIGDVYGNLGLYQPASELLQEALTRLQSIDAHSMPAATTASSLGVTLYRQGNLDGAQRAYQTALGIMKERGARDDIHVLMLMKSLAEILAERGDLDAAESEFRELLAAMRRSPHGQSGLPGCLNALAGLLADKGKPAEAVPLMREALELARKNGGGEWSATMAIRGNLAWLLALSGNNDEAETIIRDELSERRRLLPARHPLIATSLITQAVIHMNRKNSPAAVPLLREALSIREAALAESHPDITEVRGLLGEALTKTGEYEQAERLLLVSFDAIKSSGKAHARERSEAAQRLVRLYEARGDNDNAQRWRMGEYASSSQPLSRSAP